MNVSNDSNDSNDSLRDERSLVALLRCGLAEVGGPVNLLAGVGNHDVGALREIEKRRLSLQLATDHRQLHARLHRLRRPAKLLNELLRRAELRLPANGFYVVNDVKDDVRVRVHHLQRDNRAGDGDDLFLVAAGVAMVGAESNRRENERQHHDFRLKAEATTSDSGGRTRHKTS